MNALLKLSAILFFPLAGAAQPVVSLTVVDSEAAEADQGTALLRFARTGATDKSLQVYFNEGGSATRDSDYDAPDSLSINPSSIEILAGQATFDYVITPLMDGLSEGDETVILTLRDDFGDYDVDPDNTGSRIITIADDPPIVSLTTPDDMASEVNLDPATFHFSRTGGDDSQSLRVYFNEGGSAINDVDYDAPDVLTINPSSINIAAEQSVFEYVITPRSDALAEADETVILTLRDDFGTYDLDPATVGPQTVVIVDDAPLVSLTAPDDAAAEAGPDPATFLFIRSGGDMDQQLQVYFDVDGSAEKIVDYDAPDFLSINPESIIIESGQATFNFNVVPFDDGDDQEGEETVVLSLRDDFGNYNVDGLQNGATITIADFDGIFFDDFEFLPPPE